MRNQHEITLLDLLMEGHGGRDAHEVHDGRFLRKVALPDEAVVSDVFEALAYESRKWFGPPDSYRFRHAVWPDLEIVCRGRVVYAAVRYHGVDGWWEDAWGDEDEDDGSAAAWAVLFGGGEA